MSRTITIKGNPMNLVGNPLTVGQPAPDFELRNQSNEVVTLADTGAAARMFVIVPSLDTPVCEEEAKRFNDEAADIPGARVIVVSRDVPFAQKRFCTTTSSGKIETLSDFDKASLGNAWGYYVDGFGLLARGIVIVDKDGVVQYEQLVEELTSHPDYDDAIANLKKIAGA